MWRYRNKRLQSKAQVAMEFVLLVALGVTLLAIFLLLNTESRADIAQEREYAALADAVLAVRTELYTATTVSDGYMRTFTLPETLDNTNYSINVSGDVIIFAGEETEYSLRVPQFTGTLQKGDNALRRVDGQLYIN